MTCAVLFALLVGALAQKVTMRDFVNGDWMVYEVVEPENIVPGNESLEAPATNPNLAPAFTVNVPARTDVPEMSAVILALNGEQRSLQLQATEPETFEITAVGEDASADQTLLTLEFHNTSFVWVAEGSYENIDFKVFNLSPRQLTLLIQTTHHLPDGTDVHKTYYAEKPFVDTRTFFQKYQMYIMMAMMLCLPCSPLTRSLPDVHGTKRKSTRSGTGESAINFDFCTLSLK